MLRRLLPAALRGDPASRLDYEFARMSRDGYLRVAVPEPTDAADMLRARVNRLARADALDEGSGHVFDPTIAAWVQEWAHRTEAEHEARQNVLQQREVQARAEVQRLRELTELARRRLAETEQRLAWLLAGADPGTEPALRGAPQAGPETPRTERAEVEEP